MRKGNGKWIWGGVVVVVCVVVGLAAEGTTHNATDAPTSDAAVSVEPSPDAASPSSSPTVTGTAPAPRITTTRKPSASAAPHGTTPQHPVAPPARSGTALALLQTLPVKGRAAKTGYTRSQFGQAWADVDHNGCDTRNDILRRDLHHITLSGSCKVLSGILNDPYTATVIHFTRGVKTSTAVQIDHMVALSNAWQTGAQQLSATRREQLANDPLNLLAVDGPTNEAKGDGDAATWLPPNKAFRCRYVATQISVKAAYHLWVTSAEKSAMTRVLSTCPGQAAYRSTAG